MWIAHGFLEEFCSKSYACHLQEKDECTFVFLQAIELLQKLIFVSQLIYIEIQPLNIRL